MAGVTVTLRVFPAVTPSPKPACPGFARHSLGQENAAAVAMVLAFLCGRRVGRAAAVVHDDAHKIDGVFRAELLHDATAVDLHGARADAEILGGLFVGGGRRDLREHFALTAGE